jgi:SAM-dependent methyltransferase
VNVDLAGAIDGAPERFVPEEMHGQLIEAEHLGRYWWAGSFVQGKRVLDAGCGVAYGSAMLAEAGAREVVGVDVAGDILEAVRGKMPAAVSLREADVNRLPFEDDSFDVVVCFEVIEHLEDPWTALDEFARILGENGLLAVSSPNRDVYMQGNPHHRHEFLPQELQDALEARFARARLFRQHDWMASAVFNDRDFTSESQEPRTNVELRKIVGTAPGGELYTVALASDGKLPRPRPLAVLTETTDVRGWDEQIEQHRARLAAVRLELENLRAEAEALREEADQLRLAHEVRGQRLVAERAQFAGHMRARDEELARLGNELAGRTEAVEVLTDEVTWRRGVEENLREALEEARRGLAELAGSRSFRYTAPLRSVFGLRRRR